MAILAQASRCFKTGASNIVFCTRSVHSSHSRLVNMEPTSEEIKNIKTVVDALKWAQLKDEPIEKLLEAIGAEDTDHVRVLVGITGADWSSIMASWKDATPAQRSKAGVARGAALVVLGLSLPPTVATGPVVGPGLGSTTSVPKNAINKFKLSSVTNQASDTELVALDGKDIAVAYGSYKIVFGTHPPPEEELTTEQLTAVKALIDADACPYVDFAVWGAHGNRLMRKLKLHGQQFATDGTLIPTEVAGPPDHDQWLSSYRCLRTALVSWQVVDLGRIDQYATMIGRYVSRYTQSAWLQIYQADVRMRSEQMERIRRRGDEESAAAVSAGGTHAMAAGRPWDWVWAEAVKDLVFWRIELEEPAQLMLLRGSRSSASSGQVAPSQPASQKRIAEHSDGPAKRHRQERHHHVDGNIFRSNRAGKGLCEDFNRGQCGAAVRGGVCPKNAKYVHHCSRCLEQTHGLVNCPRSDFPALKQQSAPFKGGKGGKSRGKGKGGKSWQY